jgi:hypothetical protein
VSFQPLSSGPGPLVRGMDLSLPLGDATLVRLAEGWLR